MPLPAIHPTDRPNPKRSRGFFRIMTAAWSSFCLLAAYPVLAVDTGLTDTAAKAGLSGTGTDLSSKIGTIVGSLLGLVGSVFVVLMIYAGVLWMTAAGNEEQVKKAKDLAIGAVIGIVIIFSAYAITSFVLGNVISGVTRTPTTASP